MKHMAVLSASTRVRLSRKERGHCRVYLADSIETRRMHASFEKDAAKAERNLQSVLGVKGLSVNFFSFFNFPFFCRGLHVCSRLFKYTSRMSVDSKTAFPLSTGGKTTQIDSRLFSLKTIQEMSRLPHSVMHRLYWKSSEWCN